MNSVCAFFLNREDAKGAKGKTKKAFLRALCAFAVKTKDICPSVQKLRERDYKVLFFILMSETLETFWLLSLNGICAFF